MHRGFVNPAPGSTADAEQSWNYEAGLRFEQGASAIEAIGFLVDYDNIVGTCTASTGGNCTIGDQFDGGRARVHGLELVASHDLGKTLGTRLSIPLSAVYTWTEGEFRTSFQSSFSEWGNVTKGDELPYVPEHQLTLNAGLEGQAWRMFLTVNYVDDARAEAGSGSIPPGERIDSRTLVDLSGEYDLNDEAAPVRLGREPDGRGLQRRDAARGRAPRRAAHGARRSQAALLTYCAHMRAVFLDFGTVSSGDLDTGSLERVAPGIVLHVQTSAADVSARIAGFEAVFANKSVITRAMIESNPQLRLIALTATGTDNVDLAAAREAGVAVCNLRDYCTPSVVQHVFAMLLALTHRLRDYEALVHSGRWEQAGQFSVFPYPIRELQGRVFGIVGHGALGRAVARVAGSFGMQVEIANRPGGAATDGRKDLDDLLPRLDVLSLHCPLTDATRGLINAARLARMKPDAVLINTARGALVDAQGAGRCASQPASWRRRHRRIRARAAAGRSPAARSGHPQPDRHAAHRLGRARIPPALPRRAGAERRVLPGRRSPQPRRLILRDLVIKTYV